MKINIAFCPHFHQPHFQLFRTREEAFRYCYEPWLILLEKWANHPGFFINLHFSGPFLAWVAREKPEFMKRLEQLAAQPGIGIVGGLADEAFIQLSSRPDDVLFQLREYEKMTRKLLNTTAAEWQGIHVVEREAGEWLLYSLARAARILGAQPIFYFDVETYYEAYYRYPGSSYDYCRRHFGFDDQYSRTTIPHLPEEMLYFAMRDEIGGQEFVGLPVHSEFRYRLLKRQAFGTVDKNRVTPQQYLFYLKDAAEQAVDLLRKTGRDLEPLVVIFEDAEKFGQWSKDPEGDSRWLGQFFKLVAGDPEVRFCGLREYVEKQGILDWYAVSTSRSYPEWENWTARRGIRGVTSGDERLRRLINRQRDIESKMARLDEYVIKTMERVPWIPEEIWQESLLNSCRRYEIVEAALIKCSSKLMSEAYKAVTRARNMGYQEDPRWASRHPSYGSCPYFDTTGAAYLELAERLLDHIISEVCGDPVAFPEIQVRDWDQDGQDEVVVRTAKQMMVLHLSRGEIIFQQALHAKANSAENLLEILNRDTTLPVAYSGIHRLCYPFIFTEADSELTVVYDDEGGRIERCRNACRVEVAVEMDGKLEFLDIEQSGFKMVDLITLDETVHVVLRKDIDLTAVNGGTATLYKEFLIEEDAITWLLKWDHGQGAEGELQLYLVPELVTSAFPSDEVGFMPESWLGLQGTATDTDWVVNRKAGKDSCRLPVPQQIAYIFNVKNGAGESFKNKWVWDIRTGAPVKCIEVCPAVSSYYEGQVFPDQSRLGYDSSGVMIRPFIKLENTDVSLAVRMYWQFACSDRPDEYDEALILLDGEHKI